MPAPDQKLHVVEFIILIALMTSIVAMATDVMLPALNEIGTDFGLTVDNDAQFVVSAFFLGLAVGQIFVGPLSDSFGRKPIIYLGYGVFFAGCLISILTTNWTLMLLGRVLQGLGAASPRIVSMALVRDEYEGRSMAQILSVVGAVFILVPVIAPAIGQGMIYLGGWRATFFAIMVPGLLALVWFWKRQPETLAPANRRVFSLGNIWGGLKEIAHTRAAVGYTIATGMMFGMFLGYLSSAEQIFRVTYDVGDLFVLYFAIASLSLGAASLVNASLVMKLGMRKLTNVSLIVLTGLSAVLLFILWVQPDGISLTIFMGWLLLVFFCIGIIFGNLNALAMEPLGHMAGLGAAFVGALSTFMSLPFAWLIGHQFDGTIIPLVTGFFLLGALSLAMMIWTDRAQT